MKIKFISLSHGWASLRVEMGSKLYDIDGSDAFNDPLFDLLNATIRLYRGENETFVEFWNEPSSILWRLEKHEMDNRLSIHQYYSDDSSPAPFTTQRHLDKFHFEYKDTIETNLGLFVDEVIDLFDRLLNHYGVEEYKDRWYEFPNIPNNIFLTR